eukprot:gnl/TRDRNA2_/TRDRNA2_101377_c0_seq1.p1 gnl/TRDRNA2_/TRDRNA2_101377_c0~~gnl/TRDRNA2_/TRDRNA2_101377_c0_seq1.p1  ORF type:complete len:107 (+),score=7.23 gnl/TRDRNA2_/TRDRNA2_101377_c0_seq1:185-505(+)
MKQSCKGKSFLCSECDFDAMRLMTLLQVCSTEPWSIGGKLQSEVHRRQLQVAGDEATYIPRHGFNPRVHLWDWLVSQCQENSTHTCHTISETQSHSQGSTRADSHC